MSATAQQNAANASTTSKLRAVQRDFTKCGWHYKQVMRDGNVAIFRVELAPGLGSWEVVKIRARKAHPTFHPGFDRVEVYPASEEWGILGWTCTSIEQARAKAFSMIN